MTQNIPESPNYGSRAPATYNSHWRSGGGNHTTKVTGRQIFWQWWHTSKSFQGVRQTTSFALIILFRYSMEHCQLPHEWKEASVTPIFKNEPRVEVENYRPISLKSICFKTLEKLIRKDPLQHLIDNGFLSDNQHGFIYGRSCTTQLLKVVDKLTVILDRGRTIDMIYLRLSTLCPIKESCCYWRDMELEVKSWSIFWLVWSKWLGLQAHTPVVCRLQAEWLRVLFWVLCSLFVTSTTRQTQRRHSFICMQMIQKCLGRFWFGLIHFTSVSAR